MRFKGPHLIINEGQYILGQWYFLPDNDIHHQTVSH